MGVESKNLANGPFKATHMFEEIVWSLKTNLPLKTNRHILTPIENSFVGREAVEFLNVHLPKMFPDRNRDEIKVNHLLQFMLQCDVIAAPFRKPDVFKENRIYVFTQTSDELKRPKTRSRRSASFSGVRKTLPISKSSPKPSSPKLCNENHVSSRKTRMNRRLSRSNGNLEKIKTEEENKIEPKGLENEGFDEELAEKQNEYSADSEVENKDHEIPNKIVYEKKEKTYDWLPFFKSKRYQAKQSQCPPSKTSRRSVSLDRNHLAIEIPPEIRESSDDMVILHPNGQLSSSISRTRLYESIARRDRVAPAIGILPQSEQRISRTPHSRRKQVCDVMVWKRELINRMEFLIGKPPSSEWCHRIDTLDVKWNASIENIDRIDYVVKSKINGIQPDYPQTVVQFMDFLGRFPFSKQTEKLSDKNVAKIFGTLVNRLEDLDPPIYPEESVVFVDIISKHETFSEMLKMANRMGMKWTTTSSTSTNSDEVDGFCRELPVCGIRASMHRRRNIASPAKFLDSNIMNIQDETTYKIREPWLIEALQLFLLALPTARRRKLHKFVLFMRSIATNEVLDIIDVERGPKNNRDAVINGLWPGVCNGSKKSHGMIITAVLLANHRVLFSIPDDFHERVMMATKSSEEEVASAPRYAKINRASKNVNRKNEENKLSKNENSVKKEEKKQSLFDRLLKR